MPHWKGDGAIGAVVELDPEPMIAAHYPAGLSADRWEQKMGMIF